LIRIVDRMIPRAIQVMVVLGLVTLPYTHFKWMPDLGTTRPVSSVFFALAFGLVVIQALLTGKKSIREWLHWPKTWDGWPILRWWLAIIILGLLSAAITPFYGLPVQALTRLLGYVAIFTTLFSAAYSLQRYGAQSIARWVLLGYLPVILYALVELLAIFRVAPALRAILWFRSALLVPFNWGDRLSLMSTEPSFLGFQVLLLVLLLHYVKERWLRWCGWLLVALCLVFTQSGMVIVLVGIYFVLWGIFSLSRRVLKRIALAATGLGAAALAVNLLVPGFQSGLDNLVFSVYSVERLRNMSISVQIRYHYILNLVYAIWETRGLGLGIGQYGYFWKDIYLRHIDYRQFDPTGEMAKALFTPGDYMKPWSVILGIGVDLGLVGLALLIGFFWQVYRALREPRHKAVFFACLAALAGAYPIVTPHVWLALAFIAGCAPATTKGTAAA
jgi:hypothetical protein